jgi:hypothetical protein
MENRPALRNFLNTAVYLLLVPGAAFLALALLGAFLGLQRTGTSFILFVFMGAAATLGGTFWARAILKEATENSSWRPALITGITFGVLVLVFGYGLELIEQSLFRRNLLNSPGVHNQFLLTFITAIMLIVGVTSLVITPQIMAPTDAVLYSVAGAIVAALIFAGIDLLMLAMGWRVGDLDQPDRSTMLTVTGLGLLGSILAAGTTIGLFIERAACQSNSILTGTNGWDKV